MRRLVNWFVVSIMLDFQQARAWKHGFLLGLIAGSVVTLWVVWPLVKR